MTTRQIRMPWDETGFALLVQEAPEPTKPPAIPDGDQVDIETPEGRRYAVARARFSRASDAHRKAQHEHLAGRLSDRAYLKSRKALDMAGAAFDIAERAVTQCAK